jgi:site-specific DNA-methyltransferase (adenine-specific)
MQRIPDRSIDAVITDPPYGTTQCSWDMALDLDLYWAQIERVIKPTGVILIFAAQPFTSRLILSRPELYRHLWYWQKEKGTNFFRTRFQPLRLIEEIIVFAPSMKYTYNPQLVPLDRPYRHTMPLKHSSITGTGEISHSQSAEMRDYKTYTHAQPTNLLAFARENANRGFVPTQKPVALMDYLVRTYTAPGQRVLDPTMGAGSTGVACLQLDREFHGIELSAETFEIAKRRLSTASIITFL